MFFEVAMTHLIIYKCQESRTFQEKMFYIWLTNLLIFKDFFESQWILILKLSVEYIVTKYVCFLDFSVKMIKHENFLIVVDLTFDEIFAKYYHFSLC